MLWLFPKKPQDAVFFAFSLQIFATFLKIFQKVLDKHTIICYNVAEYRRVHERGGERGEV